MAAISTVFTSRSEALDAGATQYFTGIPCHRGHVAMRGVRNGCLECNRAKSAAYRAAHRPEPRPPAPKTSKEVCGVYAITNIVNDRVYVGSSDRSYNRWATHKSLLRRGKHPNPRLQRSWNKHGEAAFRFDIIESCAVDIVVEREQHWIIALKATDKHKGFNLRIEAHSNRGLSLSDSHRAALSAANTGRKMSERSRQAFQEYNATRGSPSQETRDRMRASALRRGMNPKMWERAAEVNTGRKRDPAVGTKISEALSGRKRDPTIGEKVSKALTGKKQPAHLVAKRAASNRLTWARKRSQEPIPHEQGT